MNAGEGKLAEDRVRIPKARVAVRRRVAVDDGLPRQARQELARKKPENRVTGTIDTTEELRRVLCETVRNRPLDIRGLANLEEKRSLSDKMRISDSMPYFAIRQIVDETLRSDRNPEVVFTLAGGLILTQVFVPMNAPFGLDDELWRVAKNLSKVYGGSVNVEPAPAAASGYGILTAYRMPSFVYLPGDWPLVQRFGVECGKYRQSGGAMAA